MEATTTSANEIVVLTARGVRERRPASDVRAHNFRQSGFLAASELRRIRQRHEQFIRSLAARLAIFLRLEFSLSLAKVHIDTYQKFIETLPNPSYITLFKTEPLKGAGLLVVPPRLALTLVDRLLGGPGQMPPDNRDLTDIEVALSDQSAMLILTVTASIAEQNETFQIVFPYATLEPLMRLLNPELSGTEAAAPRASKPRWNTEFDEVNVPLTAEWQGLKMSAGDITRLQPGDLLSLDPACAAQVLVRFGNIPKFFGRPGTSDAKWAVQLTAAFAP